MAEAEPFVWGAGGAQMTPATIAAHRKVAEALMTQGMDASPVRHWTQGLARVAQAALGSWDNYRADKAELANQAADKETIASLLNGGTAPAAAAAPSAAPLNIQPNAPAAPGPDATVPIGQSRVDEPVQSAGISNPGLSDAISKVAAARGVDPAYMTRLAMVESGGNVNSANPNSSARGPFQFINSTAKQYGLANPNDPAASSDAAARLTLDNKAALTQALGREPTQGELYLAHQQGAGGAAKILANPNAPIESIVGADAARLNGATPGMTAGQFAQKWTSRFPGNDPAVPAGASAQPAPVQTAQAPANAAGGLPGVNPALLQAITSPYASDGVKKIAGLILQQQMGDKVTYQTLPDGTILALDPHGRQAPKPVYSAPVKPELKEAGTDPITGQKSFQVWDPKAQTLTPTAGGTATAQPGGGMLAPGVTAIDHTLAGDDYLKQFGPEVQSAVKAYINGDVMPSGNPRLQGLASTAKTIAQKYGADMGIPVSDALYSQRRVYRSQIGSNAPSSAGGQAKAFNQGIEHMGALADTLEKLDNSNGFGIPVVASIANSVRQGVSTEQSAISDKASSIGQTLAGEVGKLFSGSAGGGVHERQMTRDRFDTVKSKPQLAAALEATLETMRGGLTALEQRRDEVLGPNSNVRFVNPETEAKIAKIEEVIARLKSGESPKASDKAPQDVVPVEKTLGNKTYIQRGGQWFEK